MDLLIWHCWGSDFLIPLQVQAWGGISLGLAVLVLDFLIWSWTCGSSVGLTDQALLGERVF